MLLAIFTFFVIMLILRARVYCVEFVAVGVLIFWSPCAGTGAVEYSHLVC